MLNGKQRLLGSTAFVVAAFACAGLASPASAQEVVQTQAQDQAEQIAQAQGEDTIVVTGSRVRRDTFTSAAPIHSTAASPIAVSSGPLSCNSPDISSSAKTTTAALATAAGGSRRRASSTSRNNAHLSTLRGHELLRSGQLNTAATPRTSSPLAGESIALSPRISLQQKGLGATLAPRLSRRSCRRL